MLVITTANDEESSVAVELGPSWRIDQMPLHPTYVMKGILFHPQSNHSIPASRETRWQRERVRGVRKRVDFYRLWFIQLHATESYGAMHEKLKQWRECLLGIWFKGIWHLTPLTLWVLLTRYCCNIELCWWMSHACVSTDSGLLCGEPGHVRCT